MKHCYFQRKTGWNVVRIWSVRCNCKREAARKEKKAFVLGGKVPPNAVNEEGCLLVSSREVTEPRLLLEGVADLTLLQHPSGMSAALPACTAVATVCDNEKWAGRNSRSKELTSAYMVRIIGS